MEENLIAGYLAYTTAVEFGAHATTEAPATSPTTVTVATASASLSYSITNGVGC
ncbi:LxmA leader domain family RiPP [Nocardia sp. NPDC051570]|uniref:LxmA leader domain family RiPP n=1 Tax=Nocardia sp. NPDC051570 TaxID=3364324 RepID=UPI0037BAD67F